MDLCELCGCSRGRACTGGCSWVAPGLCSAHPRQEIELALALREDDELLYVIEDDVLPDDSYADGLDELLTNQRRRAAQHPTLPRRIA